MKLRWLSYPLDKDAPRPPAIPAPSLSDFQTIARDGASVQFLQAYNHTGTHLDTSGHVIENGESITEFPPEDLVFRQPVVVDLSLPDAAIVQPEHLRPHLERLAGADMALFRFGCAEFRAKDKQRFSTRCPGFGKPAAKLLRDSCPKLRCAGLDLPSFATIAHLDETMTAHNVFLAGRKMLIIEEMKLELDLTHLREVRVNPWLVVGMNSGPCTVVGVFAE